MPFITEMTLSLQLKKLEKDGLDPRKVYDYLIPEKKVPDWQVFQNGLKCGKERKKPVKLFQDTSSFLGRLPKSGKHPREN
jgi:hypothetical protein